MGSLMGGWDCPVYDPKAVKYMRNKSLTKEKIEAYWKEKKETEQEHLQALSPRSQSAYITSLDQEPSRVEECSNVKKKKWRSNSLPADLHKQDDDEEEEEEEDLRKLILKKNCWWTRSNWAFLNEPPVIAGEPQYKYAAPVSPRGNSPPTWHRDNPS
ncbi:hypothetical protein Dimus_002695 [Dionaea muscipula]